MIQEQIKHKSVVEHHTKYLEIHGVDETKWMTCGEHNKLHKRLRNEGSCIVSVEKLKKISMAANARTKKAKEHRKRDIKNIHFTEHMMPNVRLHEIITYNHKTGNLSYYVDFRGIHGKKLFIVDVIR